MQKNSVHKTQDPEWPSTVERMHAPLRGFFYKRIQHKSDVEDLVQETLLRVWQRWQKAGKIETLEAYLWQTARNILKNYYGRTPMPETLPPEQLEQIMQAGPDPVHASTGLRACLLHQARFLPARERRLLLAVDLRRHRLKHIALQAGMPISTLQARLQKGRRLLRDRMLHCCGQQEPQQAHSTIQICTEY